jgi:hypothetical protein
MFQALLQLLLDTSVGDCVARHTNRNLFREAPTRFISLSTYLNMVSRFSYNDLNLHRRVYLSQRTDDIAPKSCISSSSVPKSFTSREVSLIMHGERYVVY